MVPALANDEQHTGFTGHRPALPTPARSLLLTAAGAAAMYLLDPDRGRYRRARLRDQTVSAARHLSHRAARFGCHATSALHGIEQKLTHLRPAESEIPNDPDLVQRVETALFRDPRIPKGAINISAENGTIVLRGQLERAGTMQTIERAVRKVHGVHAVRNLMHLPGTPAPNKAAALAAQRCGFIPPLRRTRQTNAAMRTFAEERTPTSRERPEAPNEPNRAQQGIAIPVPGTGRKRKAEHMRAHNAEGEGGTFEKIPHDEHVTIQRP